MKTRHNDRRISSGINTKGELNETNSQPSYRRGMAYTLKEIHEVVRAGGGIHMIGDYKPNITYLRTHGKEDELYDYRKLELPLFTPSADFKKKFELYAPHDYTGIMCFDFDKVYDKGVLQEMITKLRRKAFTKLLFVSPSGHGIKLFVMVASGEEQHDLVYRCLMLYLQDMLGKEADEKCININRGCYFSHDENAYYSEDDGEDAVLGETFIAELISKYGAKAKEKAKQSGEWVEFDASKVNSPDVKALFTEYVRQLEQQGIGWIAGKRDSLIINLMRLRNYGVTADECTAELLGYVGGRYTSEYTQKSIVEKVRRLWPYNKGYEVPGKASGSIHVINDYLSEQKELVKAELLAKRVLYINAPTGAGKTTLVKALAGELGMKMDIIMPTTALVNQQSGVCTVTGKIALTQEMLEAPVLATTYNSIRKIQVRQSEILVIDEAHSLVSDYSFKRDVVREIQCYADEYDYVIYLSGSILPLQGRYSDSNLLTFQKKNAFRYQYEAVDLKEHGKGTTDRDYFLSVIKPDTLNVFYKNDKGVLDNVYEYLTNEGYKVAYINSDNKDSVEYKGIVENETLGDDYDVLLTTCLIQAGVNIKRLTKPVEITFGARGTLIDYVQFVARFRENNPYIRIIHSNSLGQLKPADNAVLRGRVKSEIEMHRRAEERNQDREVDFYKPQHHVTKILRGDSLVFENLQGEYVQDDFLFLYNAYEVVNHNIGSNVRVLGQYLSMFNFTQVMGSNVIIDAGKKKQVDDIRRDVSKERKERIGRMVEAMCKGEHIFGASKDKKLREVEDRFRFLSEHLTLNHITFELLTNKTRYKELESRVRYHLVRQDEQRSLVIAAEAQVDCFKLKHLEKEIQVNATYSVAELREIMERCRISTTSITDSVGVIYTYKTDGGKRNYTITGKHDIQPMLKPVASLQMQDLFFT